MHPVEAARTRFPVAIRFVLATVACLSGALLGGRRVPLEAGSCPESFTGTVNAGSGSVTDVLFVNGNARSVGVGYREPFEVRLDAAPLGPSPAGYVLWLWSGTALNPRELSRGGTAIGCTVNPTPLHPEAAPQPIACIGGARLPARLCGESTPISGPAFAPWGRRGRLGGDCGLILTLQGLIEDAGSAHPRGVSVTNAVMINVAANPCSDCCGGGGYFR